MTYALLMLAAVAALDLELSYLARLEGRPHHLDLPTRETPSLPIGEP